jgi:hypothetical protein
MRLAADLRSRFVITGCQHLDVSLRIGPFVIDSATGWKIRTRFRHLLAVLTTMSVADPPERPLRGHWVSAAD